MRKCTLGIVSRNSPHSKVRPAVGNCAVVLEKNLSVHRCTVGKGEYMLHCACKIPAVASACVHHDGKCNLPVMNGYVGISLLRCYETMGVMGW